MLAAQLIFQLLNPLLFDTLILSFVFYKCYSTILEKLLLPSVKDLGLQLILLTEIRDRSSLHQVPFKNENFLLRGVISSYFAHCHSSDLCLSQSARKSNSRRTKTLSRRDLNR